ncbi:MAG: hypothetical protein IPG95_01595 [Saprospiraceae bacterium]|nr:hypothetical protein [Saprospiraceae bacterium]
MMPIANASNELYFIDSKNTFPGKLPKFKREPISSILTFQGFCTKHDQMIFSEIEKSSFDLTDRKHLLLFNYRAICHELRKKWDIISWMEALIRDDDFPNIPDERFNVSLGGHKLGAKDLEYYKLKAEEELVKGISNYDYLVEVLPYREFVTSAIFNIETLTPNEVAKVNTPNWKEEPLKAMVFTIFPKNAELILILCYLKSDASIISDFIREMGGINLNFVNKIIIEWIETWACSEGFYTTNIQSNRDEIIKACFQSNSIYAANQNELINIMK